MRFGKLLISTSALLFASSVRAAAVPEETALSVAGGFLRQSSVASRLLPGRTVLSAQFRGNLWIVALEPSGHIIIAGSDKCAPVVSFATDDFAEPEAGSALYAQLQNIGDWVAGKEADESAAVDSGWAEYTAAVSRKRLLLAAPLGATVGDGYDDFVNPFLGTTWSQGAPMTDLTPLSSPCGCAATAGGQEFRHWRWPYRFEKSRSFTHALRDSYNNALNYTMRPDGRVPIDWNKVAAAGTSSTPWETDKTVGYNTAFLTMWMQTMVNMGFKAGGSYATRKLCSDAESYWYEAGKVMSQGRDGYDNLWCAITNDLKFGSPIQINTPVHQMVIDGFATENAGTANEVDYVNTNYGWGNGIRWENLKTAIESGGGAGKFADFQVGFRPQKIVQFEPVAKISTSDLTLVWHIAPCWTNRTTGFTVQIAKAGGVTTTESVATHEETTTWMKTGLDDGGEYTFTVTPVMADGSEARANSVATVIGTPKPAPEITGVSSVACGIDLVQQGFYIECARAITNYIAVTCSESTTGLEAYSSHLTILPDEKLSVSKSGTVFTIAVDATDMPATWNGEMLLLTLVAKNADGTEAYKNLMLRFNGMRQVLDGTFEMVETYPQTPVWFCGTTVLDAKGQNITFGANAFQGNGCDVTLTDSTGGGSFSFESLDGFMGVLHITSAVTVNLPSDMSRFSGTLAYDRCTTDLAFHYTLSRNLPSTATVYLPQYTLLYLDNVTVDAAFTGNGAVYITSGTSTLSNTSGFSGTVELGDYTNAGTLTLNAGEEPGITIWNGTLYLTLSRAQVAYGYSTSQIKYNWGTVVFQDEDGKELKRWTTDDKTFTINASANTWTPDEFGIGNFNDAARWSQGIPSAGDYVIFSDNFGDTEMTLNLSSDLNLGYVKVIGTKLTIKSSGSGNLTVDTLENTIPTKLATTNIVPATVIPRGKLFVQTGLTISCDIDSSLAKNLRDISDAMSALIWDDGDDYCIWRGTVVFKDYTAAYLDLTEWGHARSFVRFNGVTGHITSNKTYDVPAELVDNGSTVALHWNDGSSGATDTFAKIFGTGTFKTSGGGGNTERIIVKDASEFTGSFQLASKNVILGSEAPSNDIGNNGRLHILTNATLAASAIWNIGGGVYLGTNCNLTVRGQLLSTGTTASIKACADDTQIIFEDGSLLRTAVALSGDYSPTMNFKAATWQATQNRTETKTVNFCASSGSYTTLDANGNKVTLGENFFSGSGDVYLTSSTDGGSFVIQGLSSAFTGTIYTDITAGLTMDDMSASTGCISISDAGLAISSAKLGNIIVGTGATLTVSLTDREAMKGFSASSVTLDGGTIEFVDQYGTVVGSSTESTTYVKPEGYTIAPVPTAVWVSGEFEDEASLHGGYAITLNDNTVNDSGNVVIGTATTLGAVIDLSDANCTNASLLVWYSLPSNGAPVANAVPLSMYDTKDMGGVVTTAGSSSVTGYYLNGSTVTAQSSYAFADPAPTMQTEGYMLLEVWAINVNHATHGTAFYSGTSIDNLSGGINTTLRFAGANNRVTKAGIGGPTLAGAKPWAGMEIKGVALFANEWIDPAALALYEFPEAKEYVPTWAKASVTTTGGETVYYADVLAALSAVANGQVDGKVVKVYDGTSTDYSAAGFTYDPETQTYTLVATAIARVGNGIVEVEFATLAEACQYAEEEGFGSVTLLAATSETIPSGWSYVSPADSGTTYGELLKIVSEIPGTTSRIALTQENVSLSADGEWAEVGTSPIYVTLGSATNSFTLSFDADIPDGVYGTLLSWDSVLETTALDSRVVITNDAAKQVIWRKADGTLSTVGYTTSELIQSGEHYIELNWIHNSGATIKVDGETYYASGSLKFTGYLTSHLAFGGSALGSPDDVLAGLKVKNLNFRVGKAPTEPNEENENFPRLGYVTRLDGTIYHGNDDNRLVITNWQSQLIHPATRPVPEGKADADFSTIDVLFVYDTPGKESVEAGDTEEWNGFSKLEVFSAKATAKMNQILCTTDMDTNFWFRMVGVHTVDGTGGTIANILGKCEGLRDEYKYMLELRDRYGADVIVTPTTQSGGYGGLARLNTLDEIKSRGQNAAYHFASVLLGYSQTHAWVHEIGHNMSLNHYPPANFDPANTSRGLGFQHKIAVDGTSMSSVMAEQGYADFCGGFSSKNHIYHGSRLSISNHLDSTGVLLEAAPYVSAWRSTRVPETAQVECSVTYGSSLPGDTEFALSYPDPEAEIYYQVYGLNNNDFVKYTEPFTVPESAGSAYISAYVVKDGVSTATNLVNFSAFSSTWDTLLGSPRLPWAIYKSIDGGWAAASGEEYLEVADSFTGSRTSESTLSTTVVGPDTLSFEHSELLKDNYYHNEYPHSYPESTFTVWVDNEPVYMLRGATNTIGSWVSTDIAIPEGTHKVDFTYSHRSGYVSGETVRIKSVALASAAAPECPATVVRVHPRLTRGLAREALLGIRFDNALGGNASAFDVHFRLENCTKADITDIKYWRQPYTHNYGFYEAEATQGPAATVSAADDATEFTASFPAGSVCFYPQVDDRKDSDYLWVTATINPEISPDAEIWVSVPTAKITLSNGGVFDVVNGAETAPHRVFPFVHQIGAYLRQDSTALTGESAGKLEDATADRVGNLTDIVVCNDFLVAYDSENDTFKTTWDARGRDNTAQVARIKTLRDQYNPKCMIRASLTKGEGTNTVDGVTGRPIACAAASAARRKQLIDSILAVMESAGLDGLDIDWEYPGDHTTPPTSANTQRDWHSYGLLMRDLAAAFFDKGYVLSFCSNLGYQMAPDGYHAAFHAADFVNAMAYGASPLNASPQVMMTGINVCRNRGVPSRRIVVGQAMYAYEVQNPGWGSVVGWLKEEWPSDKTRWWDADLVWKSRTATKTDGTVLSTNKETFEGPSSYHAKCNWCRANGYGGVMSWGYYTDVSWDDADLMSLARHQAKSCWPRTNWAWPTPPQDSDGAYLLDSEADWFWLRDNPGVAARFAADIALAHDPLPIETFSGTIDGAGHTLTISNDVWLAYDSNPALVRTLTGTVKNLTIDLYGRVVSRASRWNDTTASTTANTLASGTTHNAAVLAANLGAGGVIDGVELFIRSGAEVQGPQRVAGLAASVWVPDGSHAEIRNSSVHVEGVVRSLARNTAEGDITVANQCAGGLAGWVGCPVARNIVVTNNIVSLASTGRVAVETGSSSSAGGVIGDLNNVNPLVQGNAVYVASGAAVAANEGAGAGKVRTSYANASYSIASSANAGQTIFFIEDGAAALADSIGGKSDATGSVADYGAATDGLSVDAVAGFWYSVIYGDELGAGGIGGKTGETAPVKAAASGLLKLDTPKDGAKRFYRVKVAPVAE